MDLPTPQTPRPHYTPPASQTVEDYVRRVCQSMGEEYASDREFVQGLTRFMQLVVKAKLKYLNHSKNAFDNVSK